MLGMEKTNLGSAFTNSWGKKIKETSPLPLPIPNCSTFFLPTMPSLSFT